VGPLLAVVIALLLYGTLYPFHFNFHATSTSPLLILLSSWPHGVDRFLLRDTVLNVAIFVPLGVFAFLAVVRRVGNGAALGFAVLLGTLLSAGIEMLQIFDAKRNCSALDWLCNTAGAFLGAAVALIFRPQIEKVLSRAGRRGGAAGLLLAVCWMGAQLYPLIPLLSRTHLRLTWAYFRATPISWVEVFATAAGWFVFAVALRAAWGRMPTLWLGVAMLALPLRLLIAERVLSKSEVLAALLALVLWSVIHDKARLGVAWVLLLAAILLRELAPFNFNGRFHGFSWTLFGATMEASNVGSIAVILRKAFEYGAMVWLLRAENIGYLAGGVAVAALLGALEAMQCFLPRRQPEITDSVLALIMALVLRLVG
jgi:VanZ family protein